VKMSELRRCLGLTVTLLALSMFCAAIASGANIKITQLMRSHHFLFSEEYYKEMAAEFQKTHPNVEIEIVTSPSQADYESKVIVGAAAGVFYDVCIAPIVSFNSLAYGGFFQDLAPYIQRDNSPDMRQFLPISLQTVTIDNKLLGIPFGISAAAAVANVTMFKEAGLRTPSEMGSAWNWSALSNIANKLSRDTNGDGVFEIRGLQINRTAERIVPAFVYNAGGNIFDNVSRPTTITMSKDPAVASGLDFFLELAKADHFGSGQNWINARAALDLNQLPETTVSYAKDVGMPFEYEVAHYPRGPVYQGSEILTFAYSLFKGSPNSDIAWEWIKFLTTNRTNVQGIMKAWGNPTPYMPYMADYYRLFSDYSPSFRIYSEIMQHPDAHIRPQTPIYDEVVKVFNAGLASLINGQVSLQNFLINIDETIQPLINEFNSR
jgi:multiple sugar transport system substrate-binding protein